MGSTDGFLNQLLRVLGMRAYFIDDLMKISGRFSWNQGYPSNRLYLTGVVLDRPVGDRLAADDHFTEVVIGDIDTALKAGGELGSDRRHFNA